MKIYLEKNNSKNLIIFFCGWGMDETPFSVLKNNSDILYVYDYTVVDFPKFDFSKYEKISILAFSYGVYASAIAQLPEDLKIEKSVAISGTLIPVDNTYGVPIRQFELTQKMDSQSVVKFRQRLFGGKNAEEHFEIFAKNAPQRSAMSCTDELVGMKNYIPQFYNVCRSFDKVLIPMFDRCFPVRNQKNYWIESEAHPKVCLIETGHFPFYGFNSLDDIFVLN